MAGAGNPNQMVFGLDIGTRSIVGTVGYKKGKQFVVVAQCNKEHETRAMLDGQIHDIGKVAETIKEVKERLEEKIGGKLHRVCIAAAGRVLKTMQTHTNMDMEEERLVTPEDIYALNSLAIEEAYKEFLNENNTDLKFFCVGNSVVKYYLNDFPMSNLENHKAKKISVDMIATFLPEDVVDGLYKAVELAGLEVANMTLEPIAAIELAIPERFRLLNIALVDVGAGTSDISITKEGSIIAFGMIPTAGDSLTELIALHCMVDFNGAEQIKRKAGIQEVIEYDDIMGTRLTITRDEIMGLLANNVDEMATLAADKIMELNGDKSVGAVFVVGGGGMIPGYTDALAEKLGLAKERVALRGKEVMQDIVFENTELTIDSLLVTPIGICLNFYEESNNFVFVRFNGNKIKLYNNGNLSIVDAAMQTDFPSNGFFPKSGKELDFTVNGKTRMQRGGMGEPAVITLNGESANLHSSIKEGDEIEVTESTAGAPAKLTIGELPEYKAVLRVNVGDALVEMPKFASVGGELQSEYYEIQNGDAIEILDYYTVEQMQKFLDMDLPEDYICKVNNMPATKDTKVYENFTVTWEEQKVDFDSYLPSDDDDYTEPVKEEPAPAPKVVAPAPAPKPAEPVKAPEAEPVKNTESGMSQASVNAWANWMAYATAAIGGGAPAPAPRPVAMTPAPKPVAPVAPTPVTPAPVVETPVAEVKVEEPVAEETVTEEAEVAEAPKAPFDILITVNGDVVKMTGKNRYVYVDIFDYIAFDRSRVKGVLVTKINGRSAMFMEEIHDGDNLEVYWDK